MVSMKQARIVLDKAGVHYGAVYPGSNRRLFIRALPQDTRNPDYVASIAAAFVALGFKVVWLRKPQPQHAYFASQWLTFQVEA